MKVFAAETKHR